MVVALTKACHCHVCIFGTAEKLLATAAPTSWGCLDSSSLSCSPLQQHKSPSVTHQSCWTKAAKTLFYPNCSVAWSSFKMCLCWNNCSDHKFCVYWESSVIIWLFRLCLPLSAEHVHTWALCDDSLIAISQEAGAALWKWVVNSSFLVKVIVNDLISW